MSEISGIKKILIIFPFGWVIYLFRIGDPQERQNWSPGRARLPHCEQYISASAETELISGSLDPAFERLRRA